MRITAPSAEDPDQPFRSPAWRVYNVAVGFLLNALPVSAWLGVPLLLCGAPLQSSGTVYALVTCCLALLSLPVVIKVGLATNAAGLIACAAMLWGFGWTSEQARSAYANVMQSVAAAVDACWERLHNATVGKRYSDTRAAAVDAAKRYRQARKAVGVAALRSALSEIEPPPSAIRLPKLQGPDWATAADPYLAPAAQELHVACVAESMAAVAYRRARAAVVVAGAEWRQVQRAVEAADWPAGALGAYPFSRHFNAAEETGIRLFATALRVHKYLAIAGLVLTILPPILSSVVGLRSTLVVANVFTPGPIEIAKVDARWFRPLKLQALKVYDRRDRRTLLVSIRNVHTDALLVEMLAGRNYNIDIDDFNSGFSYMRLPFKVNKWMELAGFVEEESPAAASETDTTETDADVEVLAGVGAQTGADGAKRLTTYHRAANVHVRLVHKPKWWSRLLFGPGGKRTPPATQP